MGHRHLYNTSQIFETDNSQSGNPIHVEQPYVHLGRASFLENGSVACPTENMSVRGLNLAYQWNSAPRSNEYSSSRSSMELPHCQVATSRPFGDPFLHLSAPGNFCPVRQSYPDQPSSSSYRHIINGVESGILDPITGSGRGPYKRKSPAISDACERGNTSRYCNAGSYSNSSVSSDLQPANLTLSSQLWPLEPMGTTPSYRGTNLTIAEGSERNVRSRSTADLEANLARTHLSNNPPHHLPSAGTLIHQYGRADRADLNVSATTHEWNHNPVFSTAQGSVVPSGTSGLGRGTNQFLGGSNNQNTMEFSGYRPDHIPNRYFVVPPQNLHGSIPQVVRGGSHNYAQRAPPPYRVAPSHPRLGYVAMPSGDGLQSLPEAYSFRYSTTPSSMASHSIDRSGRLRSSYERLHSLLDESYARERRVSEGITMIDRSAFYGSRNLHDHHSDMRLDIDNMTYEQLLALEESIGNVSTGLSEDLISKCLKKTVYCYSDQIQEKGSCVICMEEYKNEEIGTLMNCGHNYHVDCIKKWLLMKNVCPICKAPVSKEKV